MSGWKWDRVHVWRCLLANFHICACAYVCVCVSSLWAREEKLFHHRLIVYLGWVEPRQKKRIDVLYTHHCLETGIFKPPRRILLCALLLHLLECCSVKECISLCGGINWIMNAMICMCVWTLNSAPCLFSYTLWLSLTVHVCMNAWEYGPILHTEQMPLSRSTTLSVLHCSHKPLLNNYNSEITLPLSNYSVNISQHHCSFVLPDWGSQDVVSAVVVGYTCSHQPPQEH